MGHREFHVHVEDKSLASLKGTTVVFIKQGEDVHKEFLWDTTFRFAEQLEATHKASPAGIISALGIAFKDNGAAIEGIDVKWTPITDRDFLQAEALTCRGRACPYPCGYATGCTCAFGPCR